jgi:hypothetical protein
VRFGQRRLGSPAPQITPPDFLALFSQQGFPRCYPTHSCGCRAAPWRWRCSVSLTTHAMWLPMNTWTASMMTMGCPGGARGGERGPEGAAVPARRQRMKIAVSSTLAWSGHLGANAMPAACHDEPHRPAAVRCPLLGQRASLRPVLMWQALPDGQDRLRSGWEFQGMCIDHGSYGVSVAGVPMTSTS